MTTIFKREWKRLFRSWFGWAFAAILLLAAGITAYVCHLDRGYTTFSVLFGVLSEVLIFLIPVMTCLTFTVSRRTGEQAWLRSLPISDATYVLAKEAALFLAFLIPTAVMGLFPLLFSAFGTISFGAAYTAWFGYVLFGATLLAICSLISSRTNNRLLSILLGIAVCAVFALSDVITGLMQRKAWISALFAALIFVAAALLVWVRGRKRLAAILTFAIPAAALIILMIASPRFLTDRLPAALHLCSPYARLSGFLGGHFDFPALVYDIAVVGFFLFLTVFLADLRVPSVRRVSAVCAAAVLLVCANIGVLFLPYRAAYPDVTGRNTFRLSDASRAALSSLGDDVTLRYLSDGGRQDADRDLYSLVVQYAEASPHIRVETVDIGTDEQFRAWDAEMRSYADQSVLVSGRRNRLILRSELYYYAYSENDMTLPLTISDYQQMLYSLANSGDSEMLSAFAEATTVRMSMESMLTNAIFFATSERAPRVAVMGSAPDRFLEQHLLQNGYDLANATGTESILAADAVLCNLTDDLTEAEGIMLDTYLTAGGRLLILADSSVSMPNLVGFLTDCGILEAAAGEPHVDATGSVVGTYGLTADIENEAGGRLVFVAANVGSYYNTMSGGEDFDYLLRAMNWLTDFEGTRVNIADPILPTDRLHPNTAMKTLWAILLIFVVPAATVALGAVTRYVRRQRMTV